MEIIAEMTDGLSGREATFEQNELIVSKTDLKGRITYANYVFQRVAGYSALELDGQPHNLIRHPHMPRSVFKLLWDTIEQRQEIFAYVLNRCRNGDHYWVFAHVTPSFDENGQLSGYHSNRRVPDPAIVQNHIIPLYRILWQEEQRSANRKDGMMNAVGTLTNLLAEKGASYEEFVFSL